MNYIFSLALLEQLQVLLSQPWMSCGSHMVTNRKYVAATATIRGADKDVQLMYGRDLNVFPPPVAEATDNFFAREDRD